MSRKEPNWYAAACGLAYCVCFLVLPIYKMSITFVSSPVNGFELIGNNPATLLMLLFGVAMIVSSILMENIISVGVGAVSAVATLIFGCMGNHMVTSSTKWAAWIAEQFGNSVNFSVFVNMNMSYGLILCLLLCIAHVALELLLGQRRTRRIQPQLWEDNSNDNISF